MYSPFGFCLCERKPNQLITKQGIIILVRTNEVDIRCEHNIFDNQFRPDDGSRFNVSQSGQKFFLIIIIIVLFLSQINFIREYECAY